MSKRYTAEEKARALQLIDANFGNTALTSAQTGIPTRTLNGWRRAAQPPEQERQQQQQSPVLREESILDQRIERLRQLCEQLIRQASRLADSLDQGIDEATLSQRATALNQVLTTTVKLIGVIPRDQTKEHVIRIEYEDVATGTVYQTPPWAVDDNEE